jgi:hypothetical protein
MKRKLALHKETVRLLVEPELRGAVGAISEAITCRYNTCFSGCATVTACSNQPPCW